MNLFWYLVKIWNGKELKASLFISKLQYLTSLSLNHKIISFVFLIISTTLVYNNFVPILIYHGQMFALAWVLIRFLLFVIELKSLSHEVHRRIYDCHRQWKFNIEWSCDEFGWIYHTIRWTKYTRSKEEPINIKINVII